MLDAKELIWPMLVAGKVVIEPFTGIEFEQEKQIDETDFHLHATAVRCMLGKVFTLTLDKLWAISKFQSSCSMCTLKTGASGDVISPTRKETIPACIDSYVMSHLNVLQILYFLFFCSFFQICQDDVKLDAWFHSEVVEMIGCAVQLRNGQGLCSWVVYRWEPTCKTPISPILLFVESTSLWWFSSVLELPF